MSVEEHARSRTLQVVVGLAVRGTNAVAGWLAVPDGDDALTVVAAESADASLRVPDGHRLDLERSYGGFVLATSQPASLQLVAHDDRAGAELALLGTSRGHLLAVPCADDDDQVAVLEVVAGEDRGRFDLDDVELLSILGEVAGAAVVESLGGVAPPTADELAGQLRQLERSDPAGFGRVAPLVNSLLRR